MGLLGYILTIVVVFALYVGLHIYVPWRLIKLLELKHKKLIYGASAFAGISIVLSIGVGATSDNFFLQNYGRMFSLWVSLFMFFVMFMGVFELVNVIKRLPPKPSLAVIAALTVGVNIYGFWNARQVEVVRTKIPIKGLKKRVSIVHVSDAHLGNWRGRAHLDQIVDRVVKINPDFVVFNGDFVDGKSALTRSVFAPLKRIKCPMYFTAGNHDVYAGRKKTEAMLRDHGVRVLKNHVFVAHGIQVLGMDYLRADNKTYDPHGVSKTTIETTMPKLKTKLREDMPVVVFHHSPIGVQYIRKAGADLLISGHTHGGQMFPWTLFAGLQFPYKAGHYKYKGMKIYVSQGAGTFGPPVRIGTINEISHIVLVPAK